MRFFACINNEKGTHTIYEIVDNKPVAIKVHPMAIEPEAKSTEQHEEAKKA